jgi:autotransporter adhesin
MKPRITTSLIALPLAIYPMLGAGKAHADPALVDVCSGLSVKLPVLNSVTSGLSGLLGSVLGLGNAVDLNLVDALNGKQLGVSVLDQNTNTLVSAPSDCALSTDSVAIDANAGISMGGGQLTGLGGAGNGTAAAGEFNSVAIGNGAATSASAANSIALGLRGTVTAVDGVAIGRDANVGVTGGVAIGAGSVADRSGMNGAAEAFSGQTVASTAGALSVGSAGSERQITNVAGGTADTDAVNVRQLRAVDTGMKQNITNVAVSLGGGASYDATTNVFVGPSYTLRGNTYTDVGSAVNALNSFIGGAGTNGAVAANNVTGLPDAVAVGADATAVGYGASAAHANSTAIGRGATTTRAGQVMIGTSDNTYTMAGVASAASRAAQTGPTRVLTTDASGNIAASNIDLAGMSSDIAGLRGDISELSGDISKLRKESRQGIAAAMAMTSAPRPSAPGKTTWGTNVAAYQGQVATSFAMSHMFDTNYPVILDAAVGYAPGGSAGVRVGVSGEF